ncbi:uncharacterized protein LOC121028044 [Herpailurus yagouaroundi]|uniref:uncharacterized protein LOC121028044 n=1 Tax=Herpailurus yagouaroundi TaxID=1608482 RepID=UPI001AD72283|nr:uncharacterized protein LOC121028044 [Puma yagouaroundi]
MPPRLSSPGFYKEKERSRIRIRLEFFTEFPGSRRYQLCDSGYMTVCSEHHFLLRQQPPDLRCDQPRIQPPLLTSAGRMWLLSWLVLVASLCSYANGGIFITQFIPSITKKKGNTAFLECQVKTGVLKKNVNIHWYRQRPDQPLKRILYISSNENVVHEQGISEEKYEARKRQRDLPASLRIHKISEDDAGLYYCACWDPLDLATVSTGLVSCICVLSKRFCRSSNQCDESGWIKIFAEGTKLIVTPPDKSPDEDTSPKPTIFLPSPAERTLHKTGTYLCLLEDFFPDVIKVNWKEENGKTILKSQQGNTMKTKDTYMKYTWLTVTEKSMDKEHTCIVKHEKNKGGVDQEILFPSINTDLVSVMGSEMDFQGRSETRRQPGEVTVSPLSSLSSSSFSRAVDLTAIHSTEASLKDENDALHLHLVNNSAYYTYLLLLLKSMVSSAIITVNLLGKPTLFGNGKSS